MLLQVHGGGWMIGEKQQAPAIDVPHGPARLAVRAINYRLSPKVAFPRILSM